MSEGKYRVALVGGAGMWGRHYLRAYAEHPECEIIALVDRAVDRAREFAGHFGIETVLADINELFAREVPDVVSAILPVGIASDVVIACAEAGVKAISCEKPIATQLSIADEMVRVCREKNVPFGCGTAYWEVPYLIETAAWVSQGNIGTLTGAAIPGGLPVEASGAGCVQLTMMRLLTGMEVEWVEGWVLDPIGRYHNPEVNAAHEIDRPAYGRLGLSGGIVCEIPAPGTENIACRVSLSGTNGQVWASGPKPVLIQGSGAATSPVYPSFFKDESRTGGFMTPVVERLFRAIENGGEALCSGHDYRQALEIAIALNLSAQQGNKRIELPLDDRSYRILPHPYRLQGGDVAGWESIGYSGPPTADH